MNPQEKLRTGLPVSLDPSEFGEIRKVIYETQKLCFQMNKEYHDQKTVNSIFSEITGQETDGSLLLLPPFYCDYGKNIEIGKNIFINMNCTFFDLAPIVIEDNVWIGPNCQLITENHETDPARRHMMVNKSITIKEKAWIGAGSTILPGVTVGKNSIIAAGSVVTRSVPDNCIVAGNPARIVKNLTS